MARNRSRKKQDPAALAVAEGWRTASSHPLFAPMCRWQVNLTRADLGVVPTDGWAVVNTRGDLHVHPTRRARPEEWAWVFTHLLLHLGFGHADPDSSRTSSDIAGAAARCLIVRRFQATLRIGAEPAGLAVDLTGLPEGDEQAVARQWSESAESLPALLGTAAESPDLRLSAGLGPQTRDWEDLFAAGLTAAVTAALEIAGGARETMSGQALVLPAWERARRWFISSYPLLGAVLSSLTIVADAELARGWDIRIAAIDANVGELYVNPHASHPEQEWRFIIAHEALHAALAHHARAGGRDAFLWNLACDFVVNAWLLEMRIGDMPEGLLHDPQFQGLSAESVYDIIATQARRFRKLATLRGHGQVDQLSEQQAHQHRGGVDLDELLRRALVSGLAMHEQTERGLLPAGLIAEIRAREHPPLAWDVHLARWFDERFPALERTRSFARPSRRQSATPDIARPGWRVSDEVVTRRTFGVVLDTSASMGHEILGKALGAIASYATSRDVPAARVVFCDAAAYDAGYLAVEEIAQRVRVKGRGGTILQPGIHLLEHAADFPTDAPILVITDAMIDVLRIRRDHAFLIPAGAALPFRPKGPVFRIQ